MKLIPLRTAAIAGTCAVALSFVALPAWASPTVSSSSTIAAASVSGSGDDATGDPSTGDEAEHESEDESDDLADDSTGGASDGSSLPAEQGHPALRLERTTISPAELAKHGVTAVATGLTPGVRYQPFWSSTQMGDTIKGPRKADGKGTLTFTWKPGKTRASEPTTWTIGVGGVETDMTNVTQTLVVKYGSDLTWGGATRHGSTVTLRASLDREGRSGKDAAWKKVPVAFQKQVGDVWVTVRTKRTNGNGVAKVTVKAEAGTVWRVVVDGTSTVAGSKTKGHRR